MAYLSEITSETEHRVVQDYRVSVTLTVRDAEQLWRMAAAHALNTADLDEADLDDVIGPAEDPQINDCLAMLLAPSGIAGCLLKAFAVETIERPARRLDAVALSRNGDRDLDASFLHQ